MGLASFVVVRKPLLDRRFHVASGDSVPDALGCGFQQPECPPCVALGKPHDGVQRRGFDLQFPFPESVLRIGQRAGHDPFHGLGLEWTEREDAAA